MRSISVLAISVFLTLASAGTSAEQRALLVGVGKYSVPGIDLPGIDLDLERMRETLGLMGFEDSQIRSLLDDQATSRNVTREFRTWLREGVNPEDRVVFYYSGHGSNTPDFNGDESDGVDEVLVTHDVRRVTKNGKRALTGVVDDDTMAAMIAGIPSNNIWIIVDACHSGTVTRDILLENLSLGDNPVYEKSFAYEGMPQGSEFVFDREFETEGEPNFVSMSAAGDNEKALGTFSGGIFTIGLSKAIEEAAKNSETLTVNELRDKAAAYIREHVDESKLHHPQVTGSDKLANGALNIIPLTGGNGPNRQKLIAMVEEQENTFELTANKEIFIVDDPVELTMNIPRDGYLNLVTVDSQDTATVLFPNNYHADNAVSEGPFTIPTDRMDFLLPAAEPLGPTLVVGFVTSDPVNFYENSLDERDKDGNINVVFTSMSHTATRAIRVAPRKKEMYAARLEIDVVK
jgi:hypothetical protein